VTGRRTLALVCLFAFVGFGHENSIAPILPLIVLERGGDAALVGVLVAAYGIPSIVLRPLLGRWLDTPHRPRIVRTGAAIVGLAPLGYLVPTLPSMIATRTVQGIGWAAYGTAGHAILARVAPAGRRGEAAGYYNAMPALAVLIGPAVGLWLFANVGDAAPFLLSSILGLTGLALTRFLPLEAHPAPGASLGVAGGAVPAGRPRLVAGLFDPVAVVPMVLIATFMSVQSLFVIFAPVYARAQQIPIEQLAIYFPAYGLVVLVSQLTLGRVSDRFGRRPTVALGCAIAVAGLATSGVAGGLGGLLLGGAMYGVATALTTSSLGAVAMESAPPERMGSAMATYSLGYQLGTSVGGAAWGAIISAVGYPWPFAGGAIVLAGTLALAVALVPRRLGSQTTA
jgi:MFS family permease